MSTSTDAAKPRAAARLLIVDDLAGDREILARCFEPCGYECEQAGGGGEALALLARERFDLVLLDILMPEIEGTEVLRRIRQDEALAGLPVIMVTAKADGADVVQALTSGADDYVTKPFDFAVVRARIRTQIARKHAQDELRRANLDLEALVESLREATARAEAANRAKSEFLANMSHEIRTPLNGVVGMASVLSGLVVDPAQREMASMIESSGIALERLLSDVLDLARIEAGRLEVREEPFQVCEVVRHSAALFAGRAAQKGLELKVHLPPEAERLVVGDGFRLRQILTNLLSNAIKFTASGSVTLRVRPEAGANTFAFEVEDTGIGFEGGSAAKLFQRFEQADGSIAPKYGGSGLGLAISKDLAELMGGTLEARSAHGQGAVFTLVLPLPASGAMALPDGEPGHEQTVSIGADLQGRGLRILLADDNPVNRRVAELILAAAGLDVVSVENGAEALEAFAAARFDLVLMDLQMPVMDGLAAIRLLRERERTQKLSPTPVLALTADTLPEHVEASKAAGATAHVAKPISAAALLVAIGSALGPADQKAGQAADALHCGTTFANPRRRTRYEA